MTTVAEALQQKNALIKFARFTRHFVRFLAMSLALIFAWLKLRGVPLPDLGSDTVALALLRSALVIYYFSWVWGVLLDTKDEEMILPFRPGKGPYPLSAIVIPIGITTVFGLLCWVDTYQRFAAVLAGFWAINIISWRYLVIVLLRTTIQDAHDLFRREQAFFAAERVRELDRYLNGSWQWWRFGFGAAAIAGLNILVGVGGHTAIASRVAWLSPSSLASLLVFLFVVSMESWVWFFRLKRHVALEVLERLEETHALAERAAPPDSTA